MYLMSICNTASKVQYNVFLLIKYSAMRRIGSIQSLSINDSTSNFSE